MKILRILTYLLVAISAIAVATVWGKQEPSIIAGLVMDVATFVAFFYAYETTKDKFWLINFVAVPFSFVSDMYFIPNFTGIIWSKSLGAGIGMNTWQGIHLLILAIGCFFYFKKSHYRYLILITLALTMLTNISSGLLSRGPIAYLTGVTLQTTVFGYMVLYGLKNSNLMYSAGSFTQWIAAALVFAFYFTVSHDITPFCLTWTDKIFCIGRLLTAIGAVQEEQSR